MARKINKKNDSNKEAGYFIKEVVKSNVPKETFKSRAEKIAESNVYVGNWMFKNARQEFPYEPQMRTVDKYFPHAKCGVLLVDEPELADDIAKCEKKKEVLKRLGYNYIILKPHTNIDEAKVELELRG